MRLYLVRHAAPAVGGPESPAVHWHLSPEGRAAADALAGAPYWSELSVLYTSPEPKALGTAQRIAARHGLPIRVERDLREVEGRSWANEGYEDLARRYLAGEDVGWEAKAAVLTRVRSCIDRIVKRGEGSDAAVVSHGLALTVLLADRLALDGSAAHELWSRMRLPDVAVLDTETGTLAREFGGGDHSQRPLQQ